jgi:lon-related putative ATP-dependent protease
MGAIQSEMESTVREVDKIKQKEETVLENLMQEVTHYIVKSRMEVLKSEYQNSADILSYLDEVQEDIIENFNIFLPSDKSETQLESSLDQPQKPNFHQYQINVLVEQLSTNGAPVILESNPTYSNVFGNIEKRSYGETISINFGSIQAGSLLHANGGYLIMEIEHLLANSLVWDSLKRALRTQVLQIEDIAEETGFGTTALKHQPIPLDIKVILLGDYDTFEKLQNEDPTFDRVFKVRADFDSEVARTPATIQKYARFIARVCNEENLLPLTPEAVSAIVEYGGKNAENRNMLSIRFRTINNVLKEADYWARKNNARLVSKKYVIKAFHEYRFRYNLYEEKMHTSYIDDTIMINVKDEVVGQVNALSVYQVGEISFGRPTRITAETFMGKESLINIEREAKLSGSSHDKGMLILSGYLGRTFAQYYPLNVSISITFEQSYGEVDGDSASSTELYAILSSLSDIPIKQGIAVTGSVNQKGKIQAIEYVNQKIEGFYDVCVEKGLTGKQGVIIPRANIKNLMLRNDLVDAVKKKKFHIYQVSTVEEGIEILTGFLAGIPDKDGNYPESTVYGEVQKKLKSYFKRHMKMREEFSIGLDKVY